MDMGLHRGSHVCVQLCRGVRADLQSQVGMHTCTDALHILTKLWDQDNG